MTAFEEFSLRLKELVNSFGHHFSTIREQGLGEAELRIEYLDALFTSLGWDVNNSRHAPLHAREVVVEPPHRFQGGSKRPDYLFRIGGVDKLICEAKRPLDHIERHFFQTQNYVYNLRLWVGILSDFEHFIVFAVGGAPQKEHPFDPIPGWRLHFTNYEARASAIWELFSRDAVAAGSIERFVQDLEKVSARARQGWLIKPDRIRQVDDDFLEFLEQQRARLSRELHDDNPHERWTDQSLTEATQCIIDRILFQRICEDRQIDPGRSLRSILDDWSSRGQVMGQLWATLISAFRHLRRVFNGGLYGVPSDPPHFVEGLKVADRWLYNFIDELSSDDTQYLFSIIPVEILGSVYERFLGSVVLPTGRIVQKPEVRKAGGVYYTPKFVVDYIVAHTLGVVLRNATPAEARRIRLLDPACGSGSFLLRAFEQLCQFHVEWLEAHPDDRKSTNCFLGTDGRVRLTIGFKRDILLKNIFGVDADPQAVEVTQMSLFLKVLEGETDQTLARDQRLFPGETYLPDLSHNIKCGNSIIDFSIIDHSDPGTEDLRRIRPFDWGREFPKIMSAGGFDVVVGNPPYGMVSQEPEKSYLQAAFKTSEGRVENFEVFIEQAIKLCKKGGMFSYIVPSPLLTNIYARNTRSMT
jgi:hypothetical protein